MAKYDVGSYSPGSKFFHWLIAILVIFMLCFGFFLDDLPETYQPIAYMFHKSLGLTVLLLMLARVIWIVHKGKPTLPASVPTWQRIGARTVQYSLYIFLFTMPISGWIMSVAANRTPVYFGLFHVPLPISPNKSLAQLMSEVHEITAWILIVLIILHFAGSMKHFFVDKDKVFQSMLPKFKK